MAIYEKKWWKGLFGKKEHSEKMDQLKDFEAVSDFARNVNDDIQPIIPDLEKLEELEKERLVSKEGLNQINLETQAEILERLLERYEYFQNDVDINGLRIKKICHNFLKESEKFGLRDLVREKKKNPRWQFLW